MTDTHRALSHLLKLCAVAVPLAIGLSSGGQAFEGYVVDAVTGAPVEDVTVSAGEETALGDRGGHFQIDAPAPRIGFRAPGYRALTLPTFAAVKGAVRLTPFQPHALYLSAHGIGSPALKDAALGLIRSGRANALVIDIKSDRGEVIYPSTVPLATAIGARTLTTIPDLATLVTSLRADGIYVIARIVVFKDDPLARSHPEWAVKEAGNLYLDREGLAWADPFRRAVWTYNIEIAKEAAAAGFDEIQFDYIRFPDGPLDLRYIQPSNAASRVEAITGFLSAARQALLPFNVFTSADFFGYVCWNANDTGIGQDLAALAGAVDYLSPMLYPSGFGAGIPGYRDPVANSYQVVRLSLEQARIRLGIPPKRFRPWLQAFRDYAFDGRTFDSAQINDQIRAAKDFGTNGWMLWNARNRYDGIDQATAGLPAGQADAAALRACL